MKFHRVSCRIFLGLFLLLQLSEAGEKDQEKFAHFMQKTVEKLIEKILTQVQEYYHEIKSNAKCIPEDVPDKIMMTLKKSIDCVSDNEKNYITGKVRRKLHVKNFLNCFAEAKREINETIKAIDPEEDYCPENATEKTYQINVTTTFTKTFQISISNGLEVTHKEIDFSKDNCVDKSKDQNENEDGENTTDGFSNTTVNTNADDFIIQNEPTQDDMDSSTIHQTDDSFDEDINSVTAKYQNDDTSDVIRDGSIDVQGTILSLSSYLHSNKSSSTSTDDSSTKSTDDFTEIHHQNSNTADFYSEPDIIYGSDDSDIESVNKASSENKKPKNKPEDDSLDEYSIEYDSPEDNSENSFGEYEESISNDYNNNNNENEGRSKEINKHEESSSPASNENDSETEAVLPNTGKKSLASDIYTQLKKLREEDDYYDIKNSGKLPFKSDNEDFVEEENENKEKHHPKIIQSR